MYAVSTSAARTSSLHVLPEGKRAFADLAEAAVQMEMPGRARARRDLGRLLQESTSVVIGCYFMNGDSWVCMRLFNRRSQEPIDSTEAGWLLTEITPGMVRKPNIGIRQ